MSLFCFNMPSAGRVGASGMQGGLSPEPLGAMGCWGRMKEGCKPSELPINLWGNWQHCTCDEIQEGAKPSNRGELWEEGAREPDGNAGCISGLSSLLLSPGDQLLVWVQPRWDLFPIWRVAAGDADVGTPDVGPMS